ncbi:CRISPR-associated helicase/endonuclease Cas3 [Desulfosarcina ovata subsp. ovata]|uniref:CRISPR-associated helicase/endonuclease Cas3 n=2 Tax=Desulfosarcina ovata TaxID=83564 RepID=A0A5K8A9F8_9BACT|nr:CRISPR-associated helicase/endonuclease Cas3 [Desulfosarcina ovata subsp. ovata]
MLVWMMGFLHDIGKATPFFQKYLAETDESEKARMKNEKETRHGFISAVIAHFIISGLVDKANTENVLWELMPFFTFMAIKRHHGNPCNAVRMPNNNDNNELDDEYEYIDKQFASIDTDIFDHLMVFPRQIWGIEIQKADFPGKLSAYFKQNIYRNEKSRTKRLRKKLSYFFIFQYLFSLLIQADKKEAIFSDRYTFNKVDINKDIVKEYIQSEFGPPKTEMDIIRSNIFNDADNTISNIDIDAGKILSLNVPTGTGKTFTCLSTALQLRARLEREKNQRARIIYTLPFTSIIDQNYQVFEGILSNPETNVLLKHHHLADIYFKAGDHEFETDESKFLIESWESEIVVTTMFQLFHSILTNRNRMMVKFEKMVNAIVLCDEIQSLPYKYWKLVKHIMFSISKLFNTWFILITATQPKIFDSTEIQELVPSKAKYFSQLDRVDISFEKDPLTLQEFKQVCKEAIQSTDESYLFVMNTVNSALELFESLRETRIKAQYYFLATNIVPIERLKRIDGIRKSKQRKIIVSTQMIEAGVDIDIDNVWRDMGPLESINQVCGRCNRHLGSKKGKVRIFQVLDDANKNKPFETYIYGKNPLSMLQTREVLTGNDTICETDFLRNMSTYYAKIEERMSPQESDKILEFMENLQFLSVYNNFKLIEEEGYERKDIFIELDSNAQKTWATYLSIMQIEDKLERKNKFLAIRKDFYDYVISVPAKYVHEKEFEETNFVFVNEEQMPTCYDKETGWIRTIDDVYTF